MHTIREAEPGYEPCAYLNGTEDPDSFKWLLALRVAVGERTFGFLSPRFMETAQAASHLLRGCWLAYCSPKDLRCGLTAVLALAPIDRWMREDLHPMACDLLLDSQARIRGLFDAGRVAGLLEHHRNGKANNGYQLWLLLFFELWCREVLAGPPPLDFRREKWEGVHA